MATHETYNIGKFWDEEYKFLEYHKEEFNDPLTTIRWIGNGHTGPFGGYMCDMRSKQPSWNQQFIDFFASMGWKDIGTSYYRMDPGSSLPEHVDAYKRYIELFKLEGKEDTIRRAVVFLEPWKSGHYAECMETPYSGWIAGFCTEWSWDAPHIAANFGMTSRYTLQVTGHL